MHDKQVVGCDCFFCANSCPELALTLTAVDCSATYAFPPKTQYRVTRSDGADMGRMMRHELLDMRAGYGCTIEFID